MEIEGKLYSKAETKKISDKLSKREFVVEYAENPMYPEFITFELMNDKCAFLDDYKTGDGMRVSFNLRGRRWKNPEGQEVIFNSLQAWRIQHAELKSQYAAAEEGSNPSIQMTDIQYVSEPDLPF